METRAEGLTAPDADSPLPEPTTMTALARSPHRRADESGPLRPPRLAVATRKPVHPGAFLETRFLKPLHLTQGELAVALGVSRRRVNELVNGRRAITPDTAIRLGMYFGNDASFWMHLQVAWDMHAAFRDLIAPKLRSRGA